MESLPLEPLLPALERPEDRTAVRFGERQLTYAQLRSGAWAVADTISGAARVAVIAEPQLETCVAVVGALLAGVPIAPLNPQSGPTELGHIASDGSPDLVLIAPGTELPEPLVGLPTAVIDVGARGDGGRPAAKPVNPVRPVRPVSPDDPALIVYTSGTTGPPKGAIIPRRAIATNLDALADAWAWTEHDVVAHALPLFHVHGLVIGILGALRRGGGAVHVGRFSPAGIATALTAGATMVFGVPTMYRRLAEAAESDPSLAEVLASARLLVSGSAPLPSAEHARLERLTGRGVIERYGLTETLMNTAITVDGEPAPGTVGPPLHGIELRLVGDGGEVYEGHNSETIGEIEVRGPNLFLGYLNRSEPVLTDGWFATGDVGTRDARGYIRIVGRRATDLIKSGGYKIGAGEIEAALREHRAVDDAAVTGEPDDDLGERVVAWVVLREGAQATEQELVDQVAAQLAPHKRPREVRFVAELPRNELGKVQKRRLRIS